MDPRPHPGTTSRNEKVVSESRRFLWVAVPKAATRSMLQVLVRNPPVDLGAQERREPLPDLLDRHPDWRDFLTFTFVRNPWARVVSTWKNKIEQPDEQRERRILSRFPDLEAGMPFEAFVEFLMTDAGSDEHADRHWLSQHWFLRDRAGDIAIGFIGRVETIADDFAVVAGRIGLPEADLPVLNTRFGWDPGKEKVASADPTYYRAFYTPRTRQMVAERYAEDIEMFGYDF